MTTLPTSTSKGVSPSVRTRLAPAKAERVTTPVDLDGADKLVGIINLAQAKIDKAKAEARAQIALIEERLRAETAEDKNKVDKVLDKLLLFAQVHRGQIVTPAGKSVELVNGTLALRLGNITVECRDEEMAIALLERMSLEHLVRVTKSLDRERMIAEREDLPKVPGVRFTRVERLHVKPVGASEVTKKKVVQI